MVIGLGRLENDYLDRLLREREQTPSTLATRRRSAPTPTPHYLGLFPRITCPEAMVHCANSSPPPPPARVWVKLGPKRGVKRATLKGVKHRWRGRATCGFREDCESARLTVFPPPPLFSRFSHLRCVRIPFSYVFLLKEE